MEYDRLFLQFSSYQNHHSKHENDLFLQRKKQEKMNLKLNSQLKNALSRVLYLVDENQKVLKESNFIKKRNETLEKKMIHYILLDQITKKYPNIKKKNNVACQTESGMNDKSGRNGGRNEEEVLESTTLFSIPIEEEEEDVILQQYHDGFLSYYKKKPQ